MSTDCKYFEQCKKRLETYPINHIDRIRTDLKSCSPNICLAFSREYAQKLKEKKDKKKIDN